MAVAVIIDFPGGNAQEYEQVTGKLFPEGKLPEGWQVHIAGVACLPSYFQRPFDAIFWLLKDLRGLGGQR